MVYDYWVGADNPTIRLDTKYSHRNVRLHDGLLQMKQSGYSDSDLEQRRPVSLAGIQTRRLDILHGTFRTVFKLEGAQGGSCASFFWYRDDATEIDIEAVTQGTSLVNNTINYTLQPSLFADGRRIPNATLSIPLADQYNTNIKKYHEHRFDCDLREGVKFYLDGDLVHTDAHNIPLAGGNLQLKLWADGNKWWSRKPSSTDVLMSVRSIIAYYNTTGTEDGSDHGWFNSCTKAGGPSDRTICKASVEIAAKAEYSNVATIHPAITTYGVHTVVMPDGSTHTFEPIPTFSPTHNNGHHLRPASVISSMARLKNALLTSLPCFPFEILPCFSNNKSKLDPRKPEPLVPSFSQPVSAAIKIRPPLGPLRGMKLTFP